MNYRVGDNSSYEHARFTARISGDLTEVTIPDAGPNSFVTVTVSCRVVAAESSSFIQYRRVSRVADQILIVLPEPIEVVRCITQEELDLKCTLSKNEATESIHGELLPCVRRPGGAFSVYLVNPNIADALLHSHVMVVCIEHGRGKPVSGLADLGSLAGLIRAPKPEERSIPILPTVSKRIITTGEWSSSRVVMVDSESRQVVASGSLTDPRLEATLTYPALPNVAAYLITDDLKRIVPASIEADAIRFDHSQSRPLLEGYREHVFSMNNALDTVLSLWCWPVMPWGQTVPGVGPIIATAKPNEPVMVPNFGTKLFVQLRDNRRLTYFANVFESIGDMPSQLNRSRLQIRSITSPFDDPHTVRDLGATYAYLVCESTGHVIGREVDCVPWTSPMLLPGKYHLLLRCDSGLFAMKKFEVRMDNVTSMNLEMEVAPVFAGRATDDQGRPVPAIVVRGSPQSVAPWAIATTNRDGRFSIIGRPNSRMLEVLVVDERFTGGARLIEGKETALNVEDQR